MESVTESDLLDALRVASRGKQGGQGEGLRVEELIEELGACRAIVARMIRAGLDNGTIRRSRKTFERINGVVAWSSSYVLAKPVKK